MRAKVIGITKPDKGYRVQNLALKLAIYLAGGNSIDLVVSENKTDITIDGLIITGGTDVHPSLYNGSDIKADYRYDQERDLFESAWIKKAIHQNIPILGICRGAQLINVVLGGNLYSNIREIFTGARYPNTILSKVFYRKKTNINPNTHLYRVFNSTEVTINSLHEQAIDELGENLKISSVENNDLVQAIEHKNHKYILGVQFHPELLIYREDINSFFRYFLAQC